MTNKKLSFIFKDPMAFSVANWKKWEAEARERLNDMLGADRAKRFIQKIKKLTGYDTDKCYIIQDRRIAERVEEAIEKGIPYIIEGRYEEDEWIPIKIYF